MPDKIMNILRISSVATFYFPFIIQWFSKQKNLAHKITNGGNKRILEDTPVVHSFLLQDEI